MPMAPSEFGQSLIVLPEERQKIQEEIAAPYVKLPTLPSVEEVPPLKFEPGYAYGPIGTQVLRTLYNTAKSMPEFASSEQGMLAGLASLVPGGRLGVEAYFTADMAKSVLDQAKEAGGNWDQMTTPQKVAAITQAIATLGFTGLLAKAAVGTARGMLPKPPAPPSPPSGGTVASPLNPSVRIPGRPTEPTVVRPEAAIEPTPAELQAELDSELGQETTAPVPAVPTVAPAARALVVAPPAAPVALTGPQPSFLGSPKATWTPEFLSERLGQAGNLKAIVNAVNTSTELKRKFPLKEDARPETILKAIHDLLDARAKAAPTRPPPLTEGGAPVPVPAPPTKPTAPAGESKANPHDFVPALRPEGGKPIPGTKGGVHQDIYDALETVPKLELQVSQPEHGFLYKGEWKSRREAADLLGLKDDLHSEVLNELQKATPAPSSVPESVKGGAESGLSPEAQAISRANNSRLARQLIEGAKSLTPELKAKLLKSLEPAADPAAPAGTPAAPASSVGLSAPVDLSQPLKPKRPYNMANLRDPAQEFTDLIMQHGEEHGWIDHPDFIAPGATGPAMISHNTEMAKAFRRAFKQLGIETDRNTLKAKAESLPKLKAFLEAHAKTVETPMPDIMDGATFTIAGEKYKSKGTNPDTGLVTLVDGKTLKVPMEGSIKIDPGSLKNPEAGEDFPGAEPTPKLRPGEKGTASLVNPPEGHPTALSGIPLPDPVAQALDRLTEGAKELPPGIRRAWRSASMQSLPRITDSNRLAGEAGVRYDASRVVARAKGIEFAEKVTQGIRDKSFDLKFGTALTEDNLRDLKRQKEELARTSTDPAEAIAAETQAKNVSTMIGKPNSPFKTEAQYQAFMRSPEAQAALARHIALWEADKDPIFRQAMDLDPDQPLATRGLQFGARVNLKNVQRDQATRTTVGTAVRSPLIRATATLKRTDPFGRAATGGGSYEGSYQAIMENGFAREYPVAKQHEFIRELVRGGDAKVTKREFEPELEIKGESTKGYPLKMRPWSGQYLQIRKSLAPEYEDVSGLSAALRFGPYSTISNVLTRSSIMGLSEGGTHAGNLLTQVFTGLGPTSNPLINAVIKSTGRSDVLYSLPKVIINAFSDRKTDMLKLAEIGAAKEPYHGAIGWFITKIDRGVRLYSADVYKKMAKAGWVEDTETGLREYVNQVGQYSKRLQPRWIQALRSTGWQPFATAMQTFNVQGLRTLAGAPGAKAPTKLAALALRADKVAGILGFAVVVTAINYLVSGSPDGPKGTKLGAIGWIGDDGRLHQFDVGMLTGFSRGARITGLQGIVEAKRAGLGTGSAMLAGAQGIGNTAISSATGPANRFAFMAVTGKRPSIPPVQEAAPAVPQGEDDFNLLKTQVAKNILEAIKQANPIVDATVRLKQGKYEEALTRQLSRYTPRTGMATETIEALPKIVAAGELNNYVDALAKEARKKPLGYERNTFVREKMDDDGVPTELRAKAMIGLQRKGVFKYQ